LKTELKIEGMMCKHCVKHVHDALAKMDGVTDVEVSLENKNAVVTSENEISIDDFAKVIDDAGYELVK
jgi:Cu+-exporting ATPase